MGTKLDYSATSLLANPQSNCGFNLNCVHEWGFFRNQLQKSNLDRHQLLQEGSFLDNRTTMEHQNLESIKKAMLMHEDIFKHQVRELHRLYSVQKLLMNEVKQQPSSSDAATQCTSWSCPAAGNSLSRRFSLENPGAYVESPARIVMAPERGGQTTVTDGVDEEAAAEVELTLSIGVGGSSCATANKNNKRFRNEQMSCNYELDCSSKSTTSHRNRTGSSSSAKSDRGGECTDVAHTMMSTSSGASDEERKRPHWLFRSLSLNNKT